MEIDKNGMLVGGKTRPSPNKGGALTPTLAIVHDTAGAIDNDSSIDWLCNPQAKASAHFVISRTGSICQLVSCNVKAWHAGKSIYKGRQNVNDFAVGIEHVNPGKMGGGGVTSWGKTYDPNKYKIVHASTPHHGDGWWMPYTEDQLAASFTLLLALRDRYGISDIAPHWEISPGRKVDTNPLFPLTQFQQKLEGREDAELTIQTKPGAVFRKWPSFYADNELHNFNDDGWFLPVKTGVYKVEGEPAEIPQELQLPIPPPQLWYNITIDATSVRPSYTAWVWSGHVKETRP